MTSLGTTPATPTTPTTPIALVPGDAYVAGACNIGAWEIRRRRLFAVVAFLGALALFAVLVAIGAPSWTRLLLIVPITGGTVSWLQARRRFCVAYALAGVSNFGDDESTRSTVVDPAQRDLDRRATRILVRDAVLIALVPTILAVIAPV